MNTHFEKSCSISGMTMTESAAQTAPARVPWLHIAELSDAAQQKRVNVRSIVLPDGEYPADCC
ncbi:MAG: hypothetical protein ACTHJQ_04430 [Rhizobiaceae bacterium]|jgi:hypothetical protein|nr:hypothetical protein [Hyphomicrobiales bacterium]